MRTLKSEALRKIIVPLRLDSMCSAVGLAVSWYNEHRPHEALGGGTPAEVYDGLLPANQQARFGASRPVSGVRPVRWYAGAHSRVRGVFRASGRRVPRRVSLARCVLSRCGLTGALLLGAFAFANATAPCVFVAPRGVRMCVLARVNVNPALRERERRVVEGHSERSNSSVYVGERSVNTFTHARTPHGSSSGNGRRGQGCLGRRWG